MNRRMISLVLAGTVALGSAAFADDTAGPTQPTRKQLMHQCMQQQKAQNSGASAMDIRTTCHAQVKAQLQQSQSSPAPSTPAYATPGAVAAPVAPH